MFEQVLQPIQKKISMRNTSAASKHYIPDQDIGGLADSIRSLYAAILTRAIKDIFRPAHSDHDIFKSQAIYWIKVNDSESITSFINICYYLDIDVDEFRHVINAELNRIKRGLPHRIKFSLSDYNLRTGSDN